MLHYISFKCFTKLQNSQTQHQRKISQKIKADNLHLKKKGHPSCLTGLLPSENQSQQSECHQSAPVKAVTAGLRL